MATSRAMTQCGRQLVLEGCRVKARWRMPCGNNKRARLRCVCVCVKEKPLHTAPSRRARPLSSKATSECVAGAHLFGHSDGSAHQRRHGLCVGEPKVHTIALRETIPTLMSLARVIISCKGATPASPSSSMRHGRSEGEMLDMRKDSRTTHDCGDRRLWASGPQRRTVSHVSTPGGGGRRCRSGSQRWARQSGAFRIKLLASPLRNTPNSLLLSASFRDGALLGGRFPTDLMACPTSLWGMVCTGWRRARSIPRLVHPTWPCRLGLAKRYSPQLRVNVQHVHLRRFRTLSSSRPISSPRPPRARGSKPQRTGDQRRAGSLTREKHSRKGLATGFPPPPRNAPCVLRQRAAPTRDMDRNGTRALRGPNATTPNENAKCHKCCWSNYRARSRCPTCDDSRAGGFAPALPCTPRQSPSKKHPPLRTHTWLAAPQLEHTQPPVALGLSGLALELDLGDNMLSWRGVCSGWTLVLFLPRGDRAIIMCNAPCCVR